MKTVNDPVKFKDISLYEFQQHIFKLGNLHKCDIMSDNHKTHEKGSKLFDEVKIVNKYIESFKQVKENGLPF